VEVYLELRKIFWPDFEMSVSNMCTIVKAANPAFFHPQMCYVNVLFLQVRRIFFLSNVHKSATNLF